MSTRSKVVGKELKQANNEEYVEYEFLDDEEEKDPYATDGDSEEYVLEKESEQDDEDEADEGTKQKRKRKKSLKKKNDETKVGPSTAAKNTAKRGRNTSAKIVPKNGPPLTPVNVAANAQSSPIDTVEINQSAAAENAAESSQSTPNIKRGKKPTHKDEKLKLAKIIEEEEIIHNLNHKLHSNLSAMSAAWDRVAKKMDKPGKYK